MNLHEPAEMITMVLSSLTKGAQRPKKTAKKRKNLKIGWRLSSSTDGSKLDEL